MTPGTAVKEKSRLWDRLTWLLRGTPWGTGDKKEPAVGLEEQKSPSRSSCLDRGQMLLLVCCPGDTITEGPRFHSRLLMFL